MAAALDLLRRRVPAAHNLRSRVLRRIEGERLVLELAAAEDARDAAIAAGPKIIGKCYGDDTGARTFAHMRALSRALPAAAHVPPAADRVLALPAALGYDAKRRCLLLEYVDAPSLRELALKGDVRPALRSAGRALAELQACRVDAGEPKWLIDHMAELMRPHPLLLTELSTALRRRIEALVQRLLELEHAQRADIRLAPAHRDLHLGQLFFGSGRVWLIDWDCFAWADPALDVGNFLMYLAVRFGERSRPMREAFLQGYFGASGRAARPRIALHQAMSYLRRVCKHYRLRQSGWQAALDTMLARAEASAAAAED